MIKENLRIAILFFLISTLAFSQKVESKKTVNCIKTELIDFLIDIERIKESDNFSEENIGVFELSDNKVLGFKDNGIYRFTDFSTHKMSFLLLKKGKKFRILTLFDISSDINEIITFLTSSFTEKEQIQYLKLIADELDKNYSLRRSDDNIPRQQKWITCHISEN